MAQSELPEFLLAVALTRPVFIWGQPGIGKSALVEQFADSVGLPCVSLLGSQLAPEDLIGVPQIENGTSFFCPPRMIARAEPYVLFLDELNGATQDVQRSFYSLIHDRRLGEYKLPAGSVVIGAGNRAQDHAITRQVSSALLNRMVHVHLRVSHRDWLAWAKVNGIHEAVIDYLGQRPDHLLSPAAPHEAPFSTPRSWHMVSDALTAFGPQVPAGSLAAIAFGCLSDHHAQSFITYWKTRDTAYRVTALIKGDISWPRAPEEADVRYFLAQSLRAQLVKELPASREAVSGRSDELRHRAKELITSLAGIQIELAQLVVGSADGLEDLPDWFITEMVRDLPRLAKARG